MKILFYIEPWIEKGKPYWKHAWIPIFKNIASNLKHNDVELYFLMGDAQKKFADELIPYGDVGIIDQSELLKISKSHKSIIDSWYKGSYSDEELLAMQEICSSRLDSFEPDIIWSFVAPVPFLEKLFPDALVLYQELGLLGRNPYPLTWYLDPFGTFGNSYISRYRDQLLELPSTPQGEEALRLIREKYQTIIRESNPFTRYFLDPDEKFQKLILLPLQYSHYFIFDSVCEYDSQYDFLIDVFENIPHDIGVIVTQHINPIAEITLNEDLIEYMTARYPNFIYKETFEEYHMSSQYLLDLVDGVASVSSTVGLQALFWQKALISVSTSHLSSLAHISDFGDIEKMYTFDYMQESRDNTLYYLFLKYYIPDQYLTTTNWLYKFLENSYSKFRSHKLDFDFYDNIDTENRMLKFFLENDQPFAKRKPVSATEKSGTESGSGSSSANDQTVRRLRHELEQTQLELELIQNSKIIRYYKLFKSVYHRLKRIFNKV